MLQTAVAGHYGENTGLIKNILFKWVKRRIREQDQEKLLRITIMCLLIWRYHEIYESNKTATQRSKFENDKNR